MQIYFENSGYRLFDKSAYFSFKKMNLQSIKKIDTSNHKGKFNEQIYGFSRGYDWIVNTSHLGAIG